MMGRRLDRLQQTSRDHPAPGKFIFSCQPDPKHQHQGNSSNLGFRFHRRRPSRSRGRHRPPPRPPRDPRETLKRPSSSGMWRCGRPRRRGWPPAARLAGSFGSSCSTFLLVFDGEVGNPWPVTSSDAPGWSAAIHFMRALIPVRAPTCARTGRHE